MDSRVAVIICSGVIAGLFSPSLLSIGRRAVLQQDSRENLFLQVWDQKAGLPWETIISIAAGCGGYVWVGTPRGLFRYDGFRFKPLPSAGGILSNELWHITVLHEDKDGSLWIATQEGSLYVWRNHVLRKIQPRGINLGDGPITALTSDKSGVVWGISDKLGVFRLDPATLEADLFTNGLLWRVLWGLTVDAHQRVWVVCRGHLLCLNRLERRWEHPPTLPEDIGRVTAIAPSADGGLWIATVAKAEPPQGDRGSKLYKWTTDRLVEDMTEVPWSQDSRRSIVKLLHEDSQGRLWCVTHGAGIFVKEINAWQEVSDFPLVSPVQARTLSEDRFGNIWIGTDGGLLIRVGHRNIVPLTTPESIRNKCFWTVWQSRNGLVWAGTDGHGVFCWTRDGTIKQFGINDGLTNPHVNAIIEDDRGTIWIGTIGGVFRIIDGSIEAVRLVPELALPTYSIKQDYAGRIWFGTKNGLVCLSPHGETTVYTSSNGIPYGPINAIEVDRSGCAWISVPPYRDQRALEPSHMYGLLRQRGTQFEPVGKGRWRGENNVRCLCMDNKGNLWIGTIGTGLFKYDPVRHEFTEFGPESGLPTTRVQALVLDQSGILWVCGENGIFGCPVEKLANYTPGQKPLSWWRITTDEGLPFKGVTGNGQPTASVSSTGLIWFANGDYVCGFEPRQVTELTVRPQPVVEEVIIDGNPLQIGPEKQLMLGPGNTRIEFRFTVPSCFLNFVPNLMIKMDGFDDHWLRVEESRSALYNLRPGKYRFNVCVSTPDGHEFTLTNPIEIQIMLNFWDRPAVRVAGVLGFVTLAGYSAWKLERTRHKKRIQRIQFRMAVDQVRERIARDVHDELGAGLTEITLLCDKVLGDGDDPVLLQETLQRIATRARTLTRQMDEVVWAVNPEADTLDALITYINEYASEVLTMAGIKVRFETPIDLPNLKLDPEARHHLFLTVKEAITNVIRHSNATEVVISANLSGQSLQFTVRDNGRGFILGHDGNSGNGLKNMQRRLAILSGICEIVSEPGSGTTVKLSVPLRILGDRATHYNEGTQTRLL